MFSERCFTRASRATVRRTSSIAADAAALHTTARRRVACCKPSAGEVVLLPHHFMVRVRRCDGDAARVRLQTLSHTHRKIPQAQKAGPAYGHLKPLTINGRRISGKCFQIAINAMSIHVALAYS